MEENIYRMYIDGKEIVLIATAHVSKHSVEQVKEIIDAERPDAVCVELCEGRYKTITKKDSWENMDIVKVIKNKQAMLLLTNMIMSSYQKRIGEKLGIEPGKEMIQGIESAKEIDAELVLADRNIQTTFKRIWANMGLGGKFKLITQVILSAFDDEEITEEDLEKMKTEDLLESALNELSMSFPELKETLVDERDQYLANKIKNAPGEKIVAVLGAAHVPGVRKEIFKTQDMKKLTEIPTKKSNKKWIGWGITVAILTIIGYTLFKNRDAGIDQILTWLFWNGTLSAIGVVCALGHPLSILTALVIAPISSLNPLLAAGWFAGLVEAFVRKPNVKDLSSLSEDLTSIKGFWKNRVTRILLVVAFANLGSTLGTLIGGAGVVNTFVQTLLN
ncbi:MAG: TraB/GumN family protein [Tissierellales bacterium]|jgi:pheromone shutdown-related protein TraB|nr:TraB/GumN family protein [Tissierellales bacterium]